MSISGFTILTATNCPDKLRTDFSQWPELDQIFSKTHESTKIVLLCIIDRKFGVQTNFLRQNKLEKIGTKFCQFFFHLFAYTVHY